MAGDNGSGTPDFAVEFDRLAAELDATPPSERRSHLWKALYQLDPERLVGLSGPERLLCYDDRNAMQAILHGHVTEEQRQEIDRIFVERLLERIRTATEVAWLGDDAFLVQQGMFTHVFAPSLREAAQARGDAIGDAILDRMDDAVFGADDPGRPPRRAR